MSHDVDKTRSTTALLLSAQRALLGEVTCDMRAIFVKIEEKAIFLRAVIDGHITVETSDCISRAGSEIASDFFDLDVFDECIRRDKPFEVMQNPQWEAIYWRRE